MKVEDYASFCAASMEWCKKESEKSIEAITNVVMQVFEHAKQASAMSDDVIAALNRIRGVTKPKVDESSSKMRNLSQALIGLKAQHQELDSTINPIIQALQFQDRISRNMDNTIKMTQLWLEHREGKMSALEFGKKLDNLASMSEEREILRRYFTDLPEITEEKGALFF